MQVQFIVISIFIIIFVVVNKKLEWKHFVIGNTETGPDFSYHS